MNTIQTIHILPNKKVKFLDSEIVSTPLQKQYISFIASVHIPENEVLEVIDRFIVNTCGFILSRPSMLCALAFNTRNLVYVDKTEREVIVDGRVNRYLSDCHDLSLYSYLKDYLYIHRPPEDMLPYEGYTHLRLPEYIAENDEYEVHKWNPLAIGSHLMAQIRIEENEDFCSPEEFFEGSYENMLFE